MFEYPEIGILPIIITDGRSFTAGYGKRDSLGSHVIVLCVDSFVLYTGKEMGPDFDLFWAMCNYVGPKRSLEVVVKSDPPVTVRVTKCIGHGASSFVYEAVTAGEAFPHDSVYSQLQALERFAIKIAKTGQEGSWATERKATELLKEKQLQNACVLPIHWGDPHYFFFIYPLGVPVIPTIDTKTVVVNRLKAEHFTSLLKDLCAIHEAGIVHRDIRLANILLIDGTAKLIDFGYATAPTTSMQLVGTQSTASQAILEAAAKGDLIYYRPEDDLESLLKVFMTRRDKLNTECEEGLDGLCTLYFTWDAFIRWGDVMNLPYGKMAARLKKLFEETDDSWETGKLPGDPEMLE